MTLVDGYRTPSELWQTWNLEPFVVLALVLAALAYTARVRLSPPSVRRIGMIRTERTLDGRGGKLSRPSDGGNGRASAFYGALVALGVALVSPLDALAETLFSAHMVQHVLIMLVAAPLLVYGLPLRVVMHASPKRLLRAVSRIKKLRLVKAISHALVNPLIVAGIYAGAIWAWHLPVLYEQGLASDAAHALEHATFLAGSLLFWALVLAARATLSAPALILVFATALQTTALGAVLTFASRPLYSTHTARALEWGWNPLDDQQLAGLIMWIPMGVVYLATLVLLLLGWLKELDRRLPASTGTPVVGERR